MHQNHLDSILVGYQVDSSQFLDSSLCAKSQGYPRNNFKSSEIAKGTWIFITGVPHDYIHNPPSLGDPATQ
jgi:hypothetical protein